MLKINSFLKLLLILCLAGIAMGKATIDGEQVTFSLESPEAKEVYIAGDFNDWSENSDPMKKNDGVWEIIMELSPGEYQYKFLVDGVWTNDPDNPKRVPDPYGGENSVLTIGKDDSKPTQKPSKTKESSGEKHKIEFNYYNPSARQVYIAGDFNNWSPDQNPLESDDEGNWSIKLDLITGKYEYKFVVDGQWQPDPDNPRMAPDSYGGINSIVEIDNEGNIVQDEDEKSQERVSNTFANSRVYIGGKYTGIAESRWNRDGDRRFRLEKPCHRIESYIKARISNQVIAFGSINLDTRDADRIYEAPLSLDSAAVEFKADNFHGQLYYNRPVGGLNDPLNIIGPSRLACEPYLRIPFGLGTGGIKASGKLAGFNLVGIYSDRFESNAQTIYDCNLIDRPTSIFQGMFVEDVLASYPDPSRFTEYGTDILGVRINRSLSILDFSLVLRRDSGTWWSPLTEISIDRLDTWVDTTGSESDWFALGNSEWLYGGDISAKISMVDLWSEFLLYDYSCGVVAGNKENDNNDDNGPVNLDLGDMDGYYGGVGITIHPAEKLNFMVKYTTQFENAPSDSGIYIQPEPSTDNDGHVDIGFTDIYPEMKSSFRESYSARATIQWPITVWAQGSVEKRRDIINQNLWDATYFGFGAKGSVLWQFIGYDLYTNFASIKTLSGEKHRKMQAKAALKLHLSDTWFIIADAAYHKGYHQNAMDSVIVDDISLPVFCSLLFKPVDNVKLEIYWGIHPNMANGWPNGRREFIEQRVIEESETFSQAWETLEDQRQIGIRGEIDF